MWYIYNMKVRKGIFDGKESDSKNHIIPKDLLGDEKHNWANQAPSTMEYNNIKQNKLPTDDELEANELFYNIELTKLKLKTLELSRKLVSKQQ